jgi:hypothetical protein
LKELKKNWLFAVDKAKWSALLPGIDGKYIMLDELFAKWSGKMVIELKYSSTNTYLIRGTNGGIYGIEAVQPQLLYWLLRLHWFLLWAERGEREIVNPE